MSGTGAFGGSKDFSVDAQKRMFLEQQERERQAAENRRATRKIRQASAGAGGAVALSGLMSSLEGGAGGDGAAPAAKARVRVVGDDDDDSIGDGGDDWSVGSEESFYVGIERADYAQPDNLEMYGESKDEDYELKEDRLGISRVSVALINMQNRASADGGKLDWDADLPAVHDEKSGSSLHEFMNASSGGGAKSSSGKNVVVATPLVGSTLDWKEEGTLAEDDDAAIDQVYQHKAAEGKMFIDKLVGEGSGPSPGVNPVLGPMAIFSPLQGASVVEGEDNGLRQMRERELRKDASAQAAKKMAELKKLIASSKDSRGKVDAFDIMKQIEKMMAE